MFVKYAADFKDWSIAQDCVWEKHNGSNAFADRFRRVHEHAIQLYRGRWQTIHKTPLFTNDAIARSVRRKKRPPQWGDIGASAYVSQDGGPRLMRSVMFARSCHGFAQHPTQKPVEILRPLIEYSCPAAGVVLDPFMGVGSTGVAAMQTGRRFIGVELDPKYFAVAKQRLREAEVFL